MISKKRQARKAAYLARKLRPEPEPATTTIKVDERHAGPTMERMVMAGISIVSDVASRKLKAVNGPQVGRDGVVRLKQSPIEWLASRGKLDSDPLRNRILLDAAQSYYAHWYEAGLSGIGAIDYGHEGRSRSDAAYSMPTSERAAYHRQKYRDARARIDCGNMAEIADAVVCHERSLADAGSIFIMYDSSDTRAAISAQVLRGALTTLADHWGMLPKRPLTDPGVNSTTQSR